MTFKFHAFIALIWISLPKWIVYSQIITCDDQKYVPPNGSRKPPPRFGTIYFNNSRLRYACDSGYILQPPDVEQTCTDRGWVPKEHPICVATKPTYCSQPPPVPNGEVLCCPHAGMENQGNYCCPVGGTVQFECHPGYTVDSDADFPSWYCQKSGHLSGYKTPRCVSVASTSSPRSSGPSLSDGMVRAVVGVTAGVLSLLLIVIALTFCKPKLKNIKRRWRDFREDENGLIINGQRVILPSYEEATTANDNESWSAYNQIIDPPCPSSIPSEQAEPTNVTRPPKSNVTVVDITPAPMETLCFSGHTGYSQGAPETSEFPLRNLPSRDDLTIDEFLRETPSTSRGFHSAFEDDFVPIREAVCRDNYARLNSPTSSTSSGETVSTPLLPSQDAFSGGHIVTEPQKKLIKIPPYVVNTSGSCTDSCHPTQSAIQAPTSSGLLHETSERDDTPTESRDSQSSKPDPFTVGPLPEHGNNLNTVVSVASSTDQTLNTDSTAL